MKKGIIALSIAAAFTTVSFADANEDMAAQLAMLKKQIAALEAKLNKNSKIIKKNAKKIKKTAKKVNVVKAHDAGDNIKWDVDFRTAVDKINYKHASGATSKNSSLMTNRLLLNMKYKADDTVTFYGTLGYNKAYGDSANHSQSNTQPGYANFDWVTNENATDNTLKVKEAYWLYANDTFLGSDISWTASIGRRPSTGGLGINFREGDKRKSALAHTVNVEFDGASFRWNLGNVTPLEGSWFKLCMGRGVTNAKQRFSMPNGDDYSEDKTLAANADMVGFIFVPYDNGQYSVHTNYAKASNMIGFNAETTAFMMFNDGNATNTAKNVNAMPGLSSVNIDNKLHDVGDLSLMTIMVKADGVGEEINDFLDNTTVFASYARSKTHPNGKFGGMLGSLESKTGNSIWLGVQMPCLLTEDGRMGIEWNKGSKYWRSVTHGEDTMTGSKIATRGTAWEIYWIKPMTKSLTFNARYTKIDYDYTGSNAFFGADGQPMNWTEVAQRQNAGIPMTADPVKSSSDLRLSIRYRF